MTDAHDETDALSDLQRGMARALRHGSSLTKDADFSAFALEHISGNDRVSPVEQLEIYREQFWLRHTGSLVEDFPGLGGILGQAEWERLAEQYLRETVPDSFTLRDLGARLPDLIERAGWLSHQALCLDMARLELAYIEVFDAADTAAVSPERLATIPEDGFAEARLVIAPSVRLLSVRYPVADLRRKLRQESDEPVAIPEASPQQLVVYRHERRLWDMPLSQVAFTFLAALASGKALGPAAELAASGPDAEAEVAASIGTWLQQWTAKGLISDVLIS
ncbi:MAG TPA: DNA-binding domain-containing protein [Polyangiaceae bacterium]|nr:DNA-binding domain-containing protein [Polyangiaceae bacterium]